LAFLHPAALLLVPLAVAAFVLWRRRLGRACALGAVVCLALAAARPQWATERHRIDRVYALDVSGSVFLDAEAALDATLQSIRRLGASDRAAVIGFAASPLVALPLTPARLVPGPLSLPPERPRSDATDIASAIRLAARQLADKGADRQIVLVTDGRETTGQAAAEAALAADDGIRIFVLPVGPARPADARIARLHAPPVVRLGEPFEVTVELAATARLLGTLALTRDGAPLAPPRQVLIEPHSPLRLAATDRLDRPGPHVYAARLALDDLCPENNFAECAVQAEGAVRLLYLSSHPNSSLAELLHKVQGLQTDFIAPGQRQLDAPALATVDCILIDRVRSDAIPLETQRAIRDWVRDGAGGLIALGGPESFGPGGYEGTPIEQALPVLCSRPKTLALLILLDASGSMNDEANGRRKIAFARDAVLATVKQLKPTDSFGLVAFSASPSVLVPLGPVQAEERLARVLDRIEPHGPTELGLALERALDLVKAAPTEMRLTLLVSDGEVVRLDPAKLKAAYQEANVGLAVLMTGNDPKAAERLAEIAGPHFCPVANPPDLPAKLVEEFRKILNRPFVPEGKSFPVRLAGPIQIARGVAPAGPLTGYVRTVPKPGSVLEWVVGQSSDPLLARWQFGLGRAVAFTSTVGATWDSALWPKDGEGILWPQAVRWAARPARTPGFEMETREQSDAFLATLHAEREGRFLNGLDLVVRVLPPEGEPFDVRLSQTAPGEYEARVPAPRRGVYRFTVLEPGKGIRLSLAVARNYAREWEDFGVHREAVDAVARNGRGEAIASFDDLRRVAARRVTAYADVDWAPLALALLLFVADVFLAVFRSRREKM